MSKKLKTAIVGTVIAVIVGIAASYGLINQQTADEIKAQTEAILNEDGTTQPAPDSQTLPPADPAPQAPGTATPDPFGEDAGAAPAEPTTGTEPPAPDAAGQPAPDQPAQDQPAQDQPAQASE